MRINLQAFFFVAAIGIITFLIRDQHEEGDILLDQTTSTQDASVGEQSLVHHILSAAKKEFASGVKPQLLKRRVHKSKTDEVDGFTLDARASAVLNSKTSKPKHRILNLHFSDAKKAPSTSLLKRMPGYVAKKTLSPATRKESARQKLEAKIASHQLTTRGLVKAVQQAEEKHFKELNEDLKDQTDDLIIAKINEITKHSKGNMNDYVLKNALTPAERKELNRKKEAASETAASPALEHRKAAARIRLQQKNPAILKSTGGAKGGDPESMLSSYDREILENGPASLSAPPPARPPGYMPAGSAPMLSERPAASAAWSAPAPPAAYPPHAASYASPYQALAPAPYAAPAASGYAGYPAAGEPYGYAPYAPYATAVPSYAAAPQAYAQPPQSAWGYGGYAAPPQQALAAPYGGYGAAAASYPPTAAAPYPAYPQYAPAAAPAAWQPARYSAWQPQAAAAVEAPGGSSGRTGPTSWSSRPPPAARRGRSAVRGAGGAGGGAGGGMAAQMAALRESILADYRATIHKGRQAGYLPPPP